MGVKVRIPTVLRKFTDNEDVIEVEGGTLNDVIAQLDARHPGFREQVLSEEGVLHRFVNIYVNDEDARYIDRLETKVTEGDVVSILPSVAGGSS